MWPTLVRSSLVPLNASLDVSRPPSLPEQLECRQLHDCTQWRCQPAQAESRKGRRGSNWLSCALPEQDWDRTGLSDVLFVAGAITAITGALVAVFGVFPRNQVS